VAQWHGIQERCDLGIACEDLACCIGIDGLRGDNDHQAFAPVGTDNFLHDSGDGLCTLDDVT